MCSFQRSTSTLPGMTRSPVNSAKLGLRDRWGRIQAGIHFDAAREVHVAVWLGFTVAHLNDNSVVNPIAVPVVLEGSVGNRGRERERRWVEQRQIEMEVDGVDVTRIHWIEFDAFASGVGTGEVHTEMITEHEAD